MKMATMVLIILVLSIFSANKKKDDKSEDVKKPDTSYTFSKIEIVGYADNPTPFYILDADDGTNIMVDLDRSFLRNLKWNVDKETVGRTIK